MVHSHSGLCGQVSLFWYCCKMRDSSLLAFSILFKNTLVKKRGWQVGEAEGIQLWWDWIIGWWELGHCNYKKVFEHNRAQPQVGVKRGSRKQQKISHLSFSFSCCVHLSLHHPCALSLHCCSFTFTHTLLTLILDPSGLFSPPSCFFSSLISSLSFWGIVAYAPSFFFSLFPQLAVVLSDVRLMANAGWWQMDVTSRWFCLSSLITQIQSAMKPELCLVKETQSGDKFIQQAIDFDTEHV